MFGKLISFSGLVIASQASTDKYNGPAGYGISHGEYMIHGRGFNPKTAKIYTLDFHEIPADYTKNLYDRKPIMDEDTPFVETFKKVFQDNHALRFSAQSNPLAIFVKGDHNRWFYLYKRGVRGGRPRVDDAQVVEEEVHDENFLTYLRESCRTFTNLTREDRRMGTENMKSLTLYVNAQVPNSKKRCLENKLWTDAERVQRINCEVFNVEWDDAQFGSNIRCSPEAYQERCEKIHFKKAAKEMLRSQDQELTESTVAKLLREAEIMKKKIAMFEKMMAENGRRLRRRLLREESRARLSAY